MVLPFSLYLLLSVKFNLVHPVRKRRNRNRLRPPDDFSKNYRQQGGGGFNFCESWVSLKRISVRSQSWLLVLLWPADLGLIKEQEHNASLPGSLDEILLFHETWEKKTEWGSWRGNVNDFMTHVNSLQLIFVCLMQSEPSVSGLVRFSEKMNFRLVLDPLNVHHRTSFGMHTLGKSRWRNLCQGWGHWNAVSTTSHFRRCPYLAQPILTSLADFLKQFYKIWDL